MLAEERAATETAANAYGTFSFNSLDDFRQNRPLLFTRTLGTGERSATAWYSALYLGDTWTGARLRLTAGARLERRAYGSGGEGAAWMDTVFGARAGRVPSHWGISPRLGWSYQRARWYLIGGAGHFRGALPVSALASALGETGGADQAVLSSVGDAAPVPLWERYAEEPAAAPSVCADRATGSPPGRRPLPCSPPALPRPAPGAGPWGATFPSPRGFG